jgi:protein-S-isoprenylcysteine O-methyltransferase Ste14
VSDLPFKIAYILGLVGQIVIRAPIERQRRQNKIVSNRSDRQEQILLILLSLSGLFALIYVFTPWLNFANYTPPDWLRWPGVAILVASLYVFWQAHHDLGRNWSPSLQIREDHDLITNGIYAYIRHPMYASQILFIIAQVLLLTNWIAGVGGQLPFCCSTSSACRSRRK